MKPIDPGTMFEAPLWNGKFAYGYVTHDRMFVLMNIYNFLSDTPGAFQEAIGKPILIRDLLYERSIFMNFKFMKSIKCHWTIKRKLKAPDALSPKYDFVAGSETVSNIFTGEIIRPVTHVDRMTFPDWRLPSPEFLPLYVQGKFEDKVVVLIDRIKKDDVIIEPARFELRPRNALGGLEPYPFHAVADE